MAEELEHEPQPQGAPERTPGGEAVPTDGAEPEKKEKALGGSAFTGSTP